MLRRVTVSRQLWRIHLQTRTDSHSTDLCSTYGTKHTRKQWGELLTGRGETNLLRSDHDNTHVPGANTKWLPPSITSHHSSARWRPLIAQTLEISVDVEQPQWAAGIIFHPPPSHHKSSIQKTTLIFWKSKYTNKSYRNIHDKLLLYQLEVSTPTPGFLRHAWHDCSTRSGWRS